MFRAPRLFAATVLTSLAIASMARADDDTTPPTIEIQQTWIEKVGTTYHFKMLLDPRDNVGIDKVEFRSALNTTAAIPAATPWSQYAWNPSQYGRVFDIGFVCSAIVIEVRAKDAAGNFSAGQTRTFKAPFPLGTAPNLDANFAQPGRATNDTGSTMDCKGLFTADFDGQGRDDVMEVDNSTGTVSVRRQKADGSFTVDSFQLPTGDVQDSAIGDFDKDGKMDLAVVVDHDVMIYHNDGLNDSDVLTFTGTRPAGRDNSLLTVVEHIAVADMSGDGFPEAVISGSKTDEDNNVTGTLVDVLVNDGSGSLYGYNSANASSGASAGRIAIGDLTADGKLDVAMIDNATRHLVIFKGRGNATLGSADDAVFADRTFRVDTHYTVGALAIGDVSGSGHNSVLVTEHYFGVLPGTAYDDGQKHNVQLWQLFSYDPVDILSGGYPEYLAVGPATPVQGSFNSDILIRDFTGDHYPEVIMTSDVDAGIRSLRLNVPLNNQNLTYGAGSYTWTVKTFLAAAHPQRLAAARAGASATYDLLVASGSKQQLDWLPNIYTTTKTSTAIIVGAASTSSDPYGNPDTVGFKYGAYAGDTLRYSISYVNNTNADVVGATIETLLPPALAFLFADPGYTNTASGTSHYLRWTLTIPANSSGVKTVICNVAASAAGGTVIAPTASLKKGTTVLASNPMPKVTVQQSIGLTIKPSSTSDPIGETAHKDEMITYTMRLTNSTHNDLPGTVNIGTTFPAGTKYVAGSVGGAITVGSGTLTPKIRGTAGKETGCDWAFTNVPHDVAQLITFQVTVTGADNTSITENTAVATFGTLKITAAPAVTKILPPLGIYISSTVLPEASNQTVARPGDIVRYDVSVHNYSSIAATNVIFADMVPAGMRLVNFYHQDGASLDFTNGSGDSLDHITFTTTTNPSYDNVKKVMGWKFASIPSHSQLSIRFDCQVLLDAPVFAIGSKTVANNVSNNTYNAVGTFGTTKSFAAVPTAGVAAATAAANKVPVTTATLLAATLAPVKIDLTGANSLPLPKLTLKKFVSDPDGILTVGSDLHFTVINDAAVGDDGDFHYAHVIHNGSGAGMATGVVLHEFIPTGVTFKGFLAKDNVNLLSYFGCHFYNAAGAELPYDLTTTTTPLVKSFTMPIGDIAANGNIVVTYKVATTLAAGGAIVSNSAAVTGKSGLYTFDVPTGYCLTSTNMNFPVVGSPKQLTVNVIAPAAFNFPFRILKSEPKVKTLAGTSETAIPVEVIGADGLDLSDIKMVVTVPKGYLVDNLKLVDGEGQAIPNSQSNRVASTGITTLTFPIGNHRYATATYQQHLDAANVKVLQDATGHLKAPQTILPKMTGNYGRSASALATALALGAPRPKGTPAPPKPIAAATTTGLQEFLLDNNASIFVGRYAPATVRRGNNLTYTIFVGNLSDVPTAGATILMNVPTGTTYVSSTGYIYNDYSSTESDHNIGNAGQVPDFKAQVAAGKLSWFVGELGPGEGGVVSLTVKVPDTYSGSRIDDNTCSFQLTNGNGKTPGPMGVVVLNGNDPSQSAAATQNAFEGAGTTFTDLARAAVETKGFTINGQSYNVTTGGCDAMHLQNDAVLIPLRSLSNIYNRVMLVGPKAIVAGGVKNVLIDDGSMRVVVGPDEPVTAETAVDVKVLLPSIPGATAFAAPGSIFSALAGGALVASGGGNLVASGGGNLVASGGGNLVAAGGGNLVAAGGGNFSLASSALVLLPANALIGSTEVGGHLVASGGGNLVAAGGGNLIAAGGGNLIAAGGGNLISNDGAGLISNDGAGIIAKSVNSLISQDGAAMQMTGTNNLFSSSTGNLVNGALVNQ